MPAPIPPEAIAAIRTLFYRRIADTSQSLTKSLADLVLQIDVQNHRGIFALLTEIEARVHSAHTMLAVFYEYLER
jgi:hypothetical protein